MRRHVLAGGGAAIAGLAGCIGGSDDEDGDGGDSDADGGTSGNRDGGTTSDSTGELDLREANVTDVSIEEEEGDREYRFSVTLYHDDEGEDGYADWWAVETKDVEELGRRELTHAHGTEEFTRSETIEIPEGVSCVVVRGHDQIHEYGGQAMLVSVPGGETEPRQQESEPDAFADASCPGA